MLNRLVFSTMMGVALLVAPAAAAPKFAPDASSFMLENGLAVVVIPDHRAPVVTHMVWYRVGAADEVAGKSGIAHFLEHLLFKGTRDHPAGEFSARIAEIGGSENAFTARDYTAYFQTVAKQHLPEMMRFEADRMANLILTDEVVLPERDVILEERRSRTDNDPAAQLSEAMGAALYQNHPYGVPIIGWEHEMKGLTREDAVAFYDRYYTPNNAILIVAGDVTEEELRPLAEATYGKLARRAEPGDRIRPQEPPALAARTVVLTDSKVDQPAMRRSYLVPSYSTANDKEAYALDLLADILGSGPTSRLYRGLVVDQAIASSAGAYYSGTSLDDTSFSFYAVPREGKTLADVEVAIDNVIAGVLADGITADELERAKRRVVASSIYAQDSASSLARMFGAALTSGGTLEQVQNWPSEVETVTLEEVNDAARHFLDKRRSVTGELRSTPAEQRS